MGYFLLKCGDDITVTPKSALCVNHICCFLTFCFAFFQVFFIESVCDDPMVVASNIMVRPHRTPLWGGSERKVGNQIRPRAITRH